MSEAQSRAHPAITLALHDLVVKRRHTTLMPLLGAQSPWQNKFYPANTIQGNFSLSPGPAAKTVSCNMMNQVFTEFAAEYAADHGSQAVRIPFSVSRDRTPASVTASVRDSAA